MKIVISDHALFRIIQRCNRFNIDPIDARRHVFEAVRLGKVSTKHRAQRGKTYSLYLANNLSFYVICAQKEDICLIKTVIIKRGRR